MDSEPDMRCLVVFILTFLASLIFVSFDIRSLPANVSTFMFWLKAIFFGSDGFYLELFVNT